MSTKQLEPIKADLFRFVTIRTPQLISEEKKKLGFIYHPDPLKSFFLKDVSTDNIDEARNAVRKLVDSFTPILTTYQEVKDLAPDLYNFSGWLIKNSQSLTEGEVAAKMSKVNNLPDKVLFKIWDNLFYQVLKRKNSTVRQACIQLILGNHFLHVIKQSDIKSKAEKIILTPKDPLPPAIEIRYDLFIRRLARARVVVSKAFSVKRESIKSKNGDTTAIPGVSTGTTTFSAGSVQLKRQHLLSKTSRKVENYKKIKGEIKLGMSSIQAKTKDLASLIDAPIEVTNFLSDETKSFLKANPTKGVTLRMAEQIIDEKIKNENRKTQKFLTSYQPTNKGQSHKKYPQDAKPYCFVLSIEKFENETEVLMTMYVGYMGSFVLSSDYQISFGQGDPIKGSKVMEIDTDKNNFLILKLFPKKTLPINDQNIFNLKGTFALNNGKTISVEVKGSINTLTNGCGVPLDIPGPGEIPGDDTEEVPEVEEPKLFGVNRLGIGIFRKVEQEVCCYVPGEVSRIENILAREYKERSTRSLISSEVIEEDTTEIEVENQSDTVSTARNELQTEIASELARDSSIGTGASLGVEGKFPGGSVTADGYFDFASSTSSSTSDSEAQTYAQEVTNSALERVLQKTTIKRTNRILEEYEENNRHGFDNREGDQHVTGVYRWIDIIYTNRLINYGKRLMIEFVIPEPARFYKMALKRQAKQETSGGSSGTETGEPLPPSEYGINSPSDINADNYLEMGRIYDVTLEDPITPEEKSITKSFGPSDDPDGDAEPNAKENSYQFKINFLEFGDLSLYAAYEVEVEFNFDYHLTAAENGTYFILNVYNETERYDKDNLSNSDGTSLPKSRNKSDRVTYSLPDLKNSLSLSVDIKNVYNFSINLVVNLKLDEQEEINWQNSVYDLIMNGYDSQIEAYEAEQAALEEEANAAAEEEGTITTNPEFNRTVEQREIQRIAIEMLTKPFGISMGKDFYFTTRCNIPQVEQTRQWEIYASHVKFFEQAIDWKLMAYLFYPYYWADKCDWVRLFQTKDASDPIFEAFLQSGMARAVIPVRPGFEEAINYYFETGDIWNGGGLVMDTDDDLYLSIDAELQEAEGFVDQEWQTRVPTSLTIVQGNSVYLEDEGLPCCDKLEGSGVDTLLRGSTVILGEKSTDSTTTETVAS